MSISASYPTLRPTLLLDFANSGRLDPRVTFSRASTATYFDETGVLRTAANDAPRFDYDPATLAARGFLIEEARTNQILYSEDFSTTWLPTDSSVSTNATTGPDGTTNADKLVVNSGTTLRPRVVQTVATSGVLTFSIFAKAAEYSFLQVNQGGTNAYGASFDLSNGTVVYAGASLSSAPIIQSVGNGWYRCIITANFLAAAFQVGMNDVSGAPLSTVASGDGTSGLYIWGAQLEAGAFATSYIPTTTTALTRAADVASVNTLSPWYNATEGTLFAEFMVPQLGRAARLWVFDSGSSTNQIDGTVTATNNAAIEAVDAGVFSGSVPTVNLVVANTTQKFASTFSTSANETSCLNAGTVASANITLPSASLTNLKLGRQTAGVAPLNGYLRRVTYYPRRLSNAELQAITA